MTPPVSGAIDGATARSAAGGVTLAARPRPGVARKPATGAPGVFADSPVWAPMPGWPAAFVPLTVTGLRFWDATGPAPIAAPSLPAVSVVWRRPRRGRLIRVTP